MDPKQQRALNNCHRDILRDLDIDKQFLLGLYIENLITEAQSKDIEVSKLGKISSKSIDINLSANWTFSLWCVPLIKSGSLNWPWCTKILGQFVTRMHQFIGQSDVKHIMTSLIKTIMSVLKATTDIITNIPTRPIRLAGLLAIMSVSTFKIAVILYVSPSDIVNSSELTVILKIIGQRDVKHIMALSINTIPSVLKFSINIITLSDSLQY